MIRYLDKEDTAERYVDTWVRYHDLPEYRHAWEGLFLYYEDGIWTAIDDSDNQCWTEDFRDVQTAIDWLTGKCDSEGNNYEQDWTDYDDYNAYLISHMIKIDISVMDTEWSRCLELAEEFRCSEYDNPGRDGMSCLVAFLEDKHLLKDED